MLGHEVAAVTARPETEAYLRDLGASQIVPRADMAETVKRPLESETWRDVLMLWAVQCWRVSLGR